MDNTQLLNVCMPPSNTVVRQCIEISRSFDDDVVRFKLGNGLFPHATVYMARFSEDMLETVKARFEELARNLSPALSQHSGYYETPGQYVEVSYQRTPELLNLHEQIVQNLKEYRHKPGSPDYESFWGVYDEKQQHYAKETGYDLAYDLYRPHITLTRYKEGSPSIPSRHYRPPNYLLCSLRSACTRLMRTVDFMKKS